MSFCVHIIKIESSENTVTTEEIGRGSQIFRQLEVVEILDKNYKPRQVNKNMNVLKKYGEMKD